MSHEVSLLGPWELRGSHGDVPIPFGQLRILLASLVLSANETVRVDTLAEQLWPERTPNRADSSVYTYVARLRKLLGPDVIQTKPGGYQLTISPDSVDVHRFRSLLRQAREVSSEQEELDLLRKALRLWRGTPFADLYSTWLDHHVVPRLTEEWFTATGRRIDLELATGHPEPLIAELQDLTSKYPVRESLWLQLITALHRAGRRAEALDAYQRVRVTLRDELGIEPGDQLVQLQRQILIDGSAGADTPRQLPHDIAYFTGRSEELAVLENLLPTTELTSPVPTIVSIDGAPGVGKTTLAVHWAHRTAHRYPAAQLYLNLRGYGPGDPVTPEAAAEMMLRALGVSSERIPSQIDERSALLRSTLADRPALILLDNARDSEQVWPLLPGGGGLVVVTSRSQLRGLCIRDGARRVTLDRLPQQQSVELLAAGVGARWVAEEPAAASALIELCDRLPLALAIVAERAQRAGSLAKVVAELENEQARLDNLDTGEGNQHTSLRAALSWSYQALSPGAAAMFRKLGMHPADDIELHTAAALADVPVAKAQSALDQLVSAHLAEQRRPNRYELHDLIRLYAAEMAEQDDAADRAATVRRVLDWYLHTAVNADNTLISHRRRDFIGPYEPSTPPRTFTSSAHATTWFEQEYACLRSAMAWAAHNGFAGHSWRIAIAMTTFFHRTISWRDGVEFYRSAIAAAQTAGETVGEAYALNCLATISLDMDDYNAALETTTKSLALFRAASHRMGEAMTLGNLALDHGELGDSTAARYYARQALTLHQELGYPRGIAQNLDNLGLSHMVVGEYDEAVEYFQQALAILYQSGDLEVEAWSQRHLGQAYAHLRDVPNSTRAFRKAIAINRALGNRRWEAIVMDDFAAMLLKAGHPKIARAMWETALAALTEFAHPRTKEIQASLNATL